MGSPYGPYNPGMTPAPFGATTASGIFQGAQPSAAPSGGTLPSGGSAADFSRADIQALLTPPDISISQTDIQKALSPIAQAAPLQMPSSLTRPIPMPGPAPLDRSPVVGAGNARAQGIGNTISASIGALAQFKAARDQHKQEADATRVQRFIEAQQAMSTADQVLAGDPKNAAALEAKKHNQDVMNGMLQDPKFVKTMEKGFNISLTDPSQNKTPEHGIVQRGIDLFKKKSQQPFSPEQAAAMSQKLQAAQPTRLAPNVMAQQALQMRQEQAKSQLDAYKERVSLAKSMMESTGKLDVERIKATGQMQIAMFNADKALDLEAMRFGNEKYLAGYRNSLEIGRDNLKRALDDKDVYQFLKSYDSNTKDYTEGMGKINEDINNTLKQMHASGTTDADRAELRTNLDRLYQTQRVLTQNHDTFAGLASKMLNIPIEQLTGATPPTVGEGVKPVGQGASAPAGTPSAQQGFWPSGSTAPVPQGAPVTPSTSGSFWPSGQTPAGTSSTGGTPSAGQQPTPDFQSRNPFSGRDYPRDFPTADKYFIEQLWNASKISGGVAGEAESASEELQSGAENIQDWFQKLPADLKKLIPQPPVPKLGYRDKGPA